MQSWQQTNGSNYPPPAPGQHHPPPAQGEQYPPSSAPYPYTQHQNIAPNQAYQYYPQQQQPQGAPLYHATSSYPSAPPAPSAPSWTPPISSQNPPTPYAPAATTPPSFPQAYPPASQPPGPPQFSSWPSQGPPQLQGYPSYPPSHQPQDPNTVTVTVTPHAYPPQAPSGPSAPPPFPSTAPSMPSGPPAYPYGSQPPYPPYNAPPNLPGSPAFPPAAPQYPATAPPGLPHASPTLTSASSYQSAAPGAPPHPSAAFHSAPSAVPAAPSYYAPPPSSGLQACSHVPSFQDDSQLLGTLCSDGCGTYHSYPTAGPFINCRGVDSSGHYWLGSILYIQQHTDPAPTLTIHDPALPPTPPPPAQLIYTYKCWSFYRWDLALQVLPAGGGGTGARRVGYWVGGGGRRCEFVLPGKDQGWRWSFYSCSGFSQEMTLEAKAKLGFDVLWKDVAARHAQEPFHLMVGGGDQLYNDTVYSLPSLKAWGGIPDRRQRNSTPFTPAMQRQVADYYFLHYLNHWAHPAVAHAFSSIPQLNMWDDHDIYDGFGSYPDDLQYSPVFMGVYKEARIFYFLFQHHTTDYLPTREGEVRVPFFNPPPALTPCPPTHLPNPHAPAPPPTELPPPSFSIVARLGLRTALVALDARSCRTKESILPREAYDTVFGALAKMGHEPPGTPPGGGLQHVVLVTGVPIVYPGMGEAVEGFMDMLSRMKQKTAQTIPEAAVAALGASGLMGQCFDEPMYLDDLRDHWGAKGHVVEKGELIRRMQRMAADYRVRFSTIGGDVHLACTGRLRNKSEPDKFKDPQYMLQIVSSAIVNTPPPDVLVSKLAASAVGSLGTPTPGTDERLRATFAQDYKVKAKLLNLRNWCYVDECLHHPMPGYPQGPPKYALNFTLVVEPGPEERVVGNRLYTSTSPPLLL